MANLSNNCILITGASQGIGRAIAISLAKAGASVALIARNSGNLIAVAEEIVKFSGQAFPIAADVSDQKAVHQAVQQAHLKLGSIDILINAAGIQAPIGPFLEIDLLEWEKNLQVNLIGTARVIHAALPHMVKKRKGKIINFSGGGATAPRPNFTAYAASKTAIIRFTETLAEELSPFNIQVNAVAPGAVNTQMLDEIISAGSKAGTEYNLAIERFQKGGTPVELVCELILFLASSASGRLTGKLISAPYDPWRDWIGKDEQLNKTPLYTIRRLDHFTVKPLIKELI